MLQQERKAKSYIVQVALPFVEGPVVHIVSADSAEWAQRVGQEIVYQWSRYRSMWDFAGFLDFFGPGKTYKGQSLLLFEPIQNALQSVRVVPLDEWLEQVKTHWVCLPDCGQIKSGEAVTRKSFKSR